ncbi:MobC family plasmid mobilization relaxosome protein [Streptomyces yunnanensis]|uniref:MobC family plasmid mobilization relaxosome protein n=1 Tax=Streptomyces yunnanensis TaxID=156453 RepID=A0ABY8ADX3_9ACTN|nr:plasmid mobilization relaxosome protein MobC [Streptomyces yunnanensis]WEB41712.1 MobC family plasmid mobilization relaxosome protein [Streptomyces yunnanensis]
MHDPHHELPTAHQEMPTTPATDAARYPAGPSNGRSNGEASAPGVAEAIEHQGVPEGEKPADNTAALPLPRAADAAAVHRVARRRKREDVQRKERVDVRYSIGEKADILAKARSLNVAAAHYVGAVVMAHVHGDLTLPGQRTQLDDYIDELNALRQQVAKIGHNINQIAKKLNSGDDPHPVDTATLAQAERTVTAVGTAVGHIAAAANQAVAKKAA